MLRFYPSAIMVAFLTTSLSACSLFGNRPCSNQNDCRIDEACSADGLCFEIRQDAGPTLRDAGPVDVAAVDATLIADVSVNDVFENDANRLADVTPDVNVTPDVDSVDVDTSDVNAADVTPSTSLPKPFSNCDPLESVADATRLTPDDASLLPSLLREGGEGRTYVLAPGDYIFSESLSIRENQTTLRSENDNPGEVRFFIEGELSVLLDVRADDVTISGIHIIGENRETALIRLGAFGRDAKRAHIRRMQFTDGRGSSLSISSSSDSEFLADHGVLECSSFDTTDAARLLDNEQCSGRQPLRLTRVRDWVVRDNLFEDFWCPNTFMGVIIQVTSACRDIVIERNIFNDNNRVMSIGSSGAPLNPRVYLDNPCEGSMAPESFHVFDVTIKNNFFNIANPMVTAFTIPPLQARRVCGFNFVHNTLATTAIEQNGITVDDIQSGIFANNLSTYNPIVAPSTVQVSENREGVSQTTFVDQSRGDLHLRSGVIDIIDEGIDLGVLRTRDIDGDAITGNPDIGADEYNP